MRLIGIDGGGTKTEAVLFDESGRVLGRRRAGPCNPNLLGFDASVALVKDCVDGLVAGGERPCAIYIGTAGIFTKDDGPRFAAAVSRACGIEKVKCENDVMNVVAAATDSDRCVAGVSGTGMKAGTAHKLVLNMLSTCSMVHLGNVYENMMVNLRPSNDKLRERMVGIVAEIHKVDRDEARALLDRFGWSINAIVAQT